MVLQRPFNGLVDERSWFFLLQIGTCYSVWRGGLRPGLFSLLLSLAAATYFYMPPKFSLAVASQADVISLLIYFILGLVIVGFGTAHHAERVRLQEAQRELHQANQKLIETNSKLDQNLQKRTEALQEIRTWISDEPI